MTAAQALRELLTGMEDILRRTIALAYWTIHHTPHALGMLFLCILGAIAVLTALAEWL